MGFFNLTHSCEGDPLHLNDLEEQQRSYLLSSNRTSLLDICANYIVNHLNETLLIDASPPQLLHDPLLNPPTNTEPGHKTILPGIYLPEEVSQRLFQYLEKNDLEPEEFHKNVVKPLFPEEEVRSPQKANQTAGGSLRLTSLNFRSCSSLNDSSLDVLLQKNPIVSLDIHNCLHVTRGALESINKHGRHLKSLTMGNTAANIFSLNSEDEEEMNDKEVCGPEGLKKFVLWNVELFTNNRNYFLKSITRYSETLTWLDISGTDNIECFGFLRHLPCLVGLVLYNVDLKGSDPNWFPTILLTTEEEMPNLSFFHLLGRLSKFIRHLDISSSANSTSSTHTFPNPNFLLSRVVTNLPVLQYLDISGTNLAGTGVAEERNSSSIPGLNGRINTPLEYLGLYNTYHDACGRDSIPAKNIAGDKDETQILNAARAFIDRHEVLEKILNDLFHIFRSDQGTRILDSLRIILLSMERHSSEKHVQISGSASLFYIVKNDQQRAFLTSSLKQRILLAIVNAMDVHKNDSTMLRNGCLTICHFKIPQDVMFLYEKLVRILLTTLGSNNAGNHEEFVERIAIYLLNSLACQVEGEQKRIVGDLGAMQKMLSLISNRLERGESDDVMDIAWSTMWNVTDETPENCQKFLQFDGMQLFLRCLEAFPNRPELLRNMMGLLGNVAEVANLRVHLMTEAFITVFYDLLDSKQDNIEVSYNAAGVLAHILSDGEVAWTVGKPDRIDVRNRMKANIEVWNINSQRNINYRSFAPILRLLEVSHTNECRLWASWALANLTRVYPDKYVNLIEKEGGMASLMRADILMNPESPELRKYAQTTIDNVAMFKRDGKINLEQFLDG